MDPNPNMGCKTNAQDQGPKLDEIDGYLQANEKALSGSFTFGSRAYK